MSSTSGVKGTLIQMDAQNEVALYIPEELRRWTPLKPHILESPASLGMFPTPRGSGILCVVCWDHRGPTGRRVSPMRPLLLVTAGSEPVHLGYQATYGLLQEDDRGPSAEHFCFLPAKGSSCLCPRLALPWSLYSNSPPSLYWNGVLHDPSGTTQPHSTHSASQNFSDFLGAHTCTISVLR
jgi:hypothetical protein